MHTASVLLLAVVLLRLDRAVAADRVYPWLTLASGVVVAVVGGWLLVSRWRRRAHEGSRRHHHDGSHHHHHHDHDHPAAAPLSRRGLVALAVSGGLFPSPTAVLVLLSAFSLHRAGLGLALVGAFSAGLAATLTAVGLVLVYGRGLAERRGPKLLLPVLPLVGASALVLAGTALALRGAAAIG